MTKHDRNIQLLKGDYKETIEALEILKTNKSEEAILHALCWLGYLSDTTKIIIDELRKEKTNETKSK